MSSFSQKITIFISIFFLILPSVRANAFNSCPNEPVSFGGSCYDVATKYEMIMKGFRLRQVDDEGNPIGFVTISDEVKTYDFAASDAGETIADYIAGGEVPAGTYDAVSPILDSVITVSGNTELAGDPAYNCATDGEVAFDLDGESDMASGSDNVEGLIDYDDSCGVSDNMDGCGADYINDDGDLVIIDASVTGFPVTVEDGDSLTFTMTVDIAESMFYYWNGSGSCVGSAPGDLFVQLSATEN